MNDFSGIEAAKGAQTTKFKIKSKSPKAYGGALAFQKSSKGVNRGINFNQGKKQNRDLSSNKIPEIGVAGANEMNHR